MKNVRYLFVAIFLCVPAWVHAATCFYSTNLTCDYFIDDAGSGTACSEGAPCTTQEAIENRGIAGKTVCVNPGTYTGATGRLDIFEPDDLISGTAEVPTTFCSLNGLNTATFDGEGNDAPLYNKRADHIHYEGLNFVNGKTNFRSTVFFSAAQCSFPTDPPTCRPDHNVFRWVIIGNQVGGGVAVTQNQPIFQIIGQGHRFYDVGVFGFGRNGGEFQRSDGARLERVVVYWTGSAWDLSLKKFFTMGYHGFNTICDNCFFYYTGEHTNNNNDGLSGAGHGWHQVGDDVWGKGRATAANGPCRVQFETRYNASMSFVHSSDHPGASNFVPDGMFRLGDPGGGQGGTECDIADLQGNDLVAYIDNALGAPWTTSVRPIITVTANGNNGDPGNLSVTGLTTIGGLANTIGGMWTVTDTVDVDTAGELTAAQSIFDGTEGAQICKRWQNGLITTDPLWPLPIAAPFAAALAAEGYTFNINDKVETIFGTVPDVCRTLNVSSCEIGTIDASTLVVNWQNNVAPPLTAVDNTKFAVEYDAGAQTENSTVIVGSNQTRTTMAAAATAGQVITVTPAAAAVTDSNSIASHAQAAVTCTNNVAGGTGETITQTYARFKAWLGSLASTDWKAAENTNKTIMAPGNIRLRLKFACTVADCIAQGYRLRVSEDSGAYADVPGSCTTSNICLISNPSVEHLEPTAEQLTSDHAANITGAFLAQQAGIPNVDLSLNSEVENEYSLQVKAGTANGTTFDFRLYTDAGDALNAYTITPRLTVSAPMHVKTGGSLGSGGGLIQ